MSQEYFYRAVLSIPLSLGKDLTTVKEDCLKARKYLESQNLEIDKITVETSTCSLLFKINSPLEEKIFFGLQSVLNEGEIGINSQNLYSLMSLRE